MLTLTQYAHPVCSRGCVWLSFASAVCCVYLVTGIYGFSLEKLAHKTVKNSTHTCSGESVRDVCRCSLCITHEGVDYSLAQRVRWCNRVSNIHTINSASIHTYCSIHTYQDRAENGKEKTRTTNHEPHINRAKRHGTSHTTNGAHTAHGRQDSSSELSLRS